MNEDTEITHNYDITNQFDPMITSIARKIRNQLYGKSSKRKCLEKIFINFQLLITQFGFIYHHF